MKSVNTSSLSSVNSVMLFLASFGISYSLVSEFIYGHSKREFLGFMICLLAVSIASRKRQQAENQ